MASVGTEDPDRMRPLPPPAAPRALAPLAARRREPAPTPDSPRHEISQVLLATDVLTVGRWRCPVDSPYFRDSGPPGLCLSVFPRTGVWIRHEGAAPFVADPTVVTYYNPGQRYERAVLDPAGDRCEYFGVAPAVMADLLAGVGAAPAGDARPLPFSHGPSDRDGYLRQRAVVEHVCRADVPDALFVEETMLDVLARLVALAGRRGPAPSRPSRHGRRAGADLAEAARAAIAAGFTEPWSLGDLAARLRTTPFHLARVFRAHTGWTLHGYRTELRMRAALERVAAPDTDLLDLALTLGYSSHSHFTATFHRAFGETPSAMRRRLAPSRPV
ncbi:MAG: helix-turn-helix transcriptional regulator [Vicinamibacterales bacterium]